MEFCNVIVGAETGLLKGVNTEKKSFQNLTTVQDVISKKTEICALTWCDVKQKQFLFGQQDGTVKKFSLISKTIEPLFNCKDGLDGDTSKTSTICGLAVIESDILTCLSSGELVVWTEDAIWKKKVEIHVGKDVCVMCQNSQNTNMVATGGKENYLKVFNLLKPEAPIFKAKNVANDWLNLRVPIWVTAIQFIPNSDRIITATGHSQVRVYDIKKQRRPVAEIKFSEYPITSLALRNENHVVVGNSHGDMALVDTGNGMKMVQRYKGVDGAIRCIQCHPTLPYVASCGLDRFLRIHDVDSKKLLSKIYLKSRLNCLLIYDKWTSENIDNNEDENDVIDSIASDAENDIDTDSSGDAEIWDSLDVVGEKRKTNHTASCAKKSKIEIKDTIKTRRSMRKTKPGLVD